MIADEDEGKNQNNFISRGSISSSILQNQLKHCSVKRNRRGETSNHDTNFTKKMDISPAGLDCQRGICNAEQDQGRVMKQKVTNVGARKNGKIQIPPLPKFNEISYEKKEDKENFSTFNIGFKVLGTDRTKSSYDHGGLSMTSRSRRSTRRERTMRINQYPEIRNLGFDVQKIDKEKSLNNDLLDFSKNILQMMKSVKSDLSSLRTRKFFKRNSQFDHALKSARIARDKIERDYDLRIGEPQKFNRI